MRLKSTQKDSLISLTHVSFRLFIIVAIIVIIILICGCKNNKYNVESFNDSRIPQKTNKTKTTIILHTPKSKLYATKICKHIKSKCITTDRLKIYKAIDKIGGGYNNIVIHPRTATPLNSKWINFLYELEGKGVKIINSPKTLQLTSNKLDCSFVLLNAGINHPLTWKGKKNNISTINKIGELLSRHNKLIIKPFNSISQGAYVQILKNTMSTNRIKKLVESIPTDPFVIQEFVEYKAIHRIIVINGIPLPFSFVDKPTKKKWKVSVCLNRDSMKFNSVPNKKLLDIAVNTQNVLKKHTKSKYKGIHFIDIFEKNYNTFTISEINTACSLLIHENLAKTAGHPDWQISKKIAGYLNSI